MAASLVTVFLPLVRPGSACTTVESRLSTVIKKQRKRSGNWRLVKDDGVALRRSLVLLRDIKRKRRRYVELENNQIMDR